MVCHEMCSKQNLLSTLAAQKTEFNFLELALQLAITSHLTQT